MAQGGGLWGWMQSFGGTCGFGQAPKTHSMWVRAAPELCPQEVPGVSEELLAKIDTPGGSLEEKLEHVTDTFRSNARHLESLQQLLRLRAIERRAAEGSDEFPAEVESVISKGTYQDSFLQAFDGQSFPLFGEQVIPYHEYRLALEVHSGGAYWSSISTQDSGSVQHKVEIVSASSPAEGSATIISHFGAAQRGAVFVWRWHHLPEKGPYQLPEWLDKVLLGEGNDPLRKLQAELEVVRRWHQQVRADTAQHIKQGGEIKDPYIREVLRLWPSETDAQGIQQLKKCAWVEGLDARLFVGRTVVAHRIPYDAIHTIVLHAHISKRHVDEEEVAKEGSPPYRLTTSWQWTAAAPTTEQGLSRLMLQERLPGSQQSITEIPGSYQSLTEMPGTRQPRHEPPSSAEVLMDPSSSVPEGAEQNDWAADTSTPAPEIPE
eukprot:CAMPEP_0170604680 /NCGR_PEP_ID=MMETSP0224-20130122/19555_1 /TAXON_ID=285029 /ORGANISM="Togula jolla, Strain CCCM 725" /LENGTH=432 /DNA_ID=CAMNT_0010929605 /DNA_START=30 /DNA_END=1325 /DNA_ORIENTATION=+